MKALLIVDLQNDFAPVVLWQFLREMKLFLL